MNGEELPNVVEIWIEDFCYVLTLWWEVRPVLKAGPDFGSIMKLRLLSWNETKIQTMPEGVVRSLGSRRFLDWGAMDAHGYAAQECGRWVRLDFHRSIWPFSREDKEALWES
ncbi:hypothetical protein CK203_096058 [Vitis vinifera]|uniref:Uncharacterized protein n=1 Tax=Vitis vinifera TaxID=29760 RepID=A0A438CGV7_VITVI|nr:hypothetical protein CK203_096058 [Vitis vinifera]